jgi:hypothetical protein
MLGTILALAVSLSLLTIDGQQVVKLEGLRPNLPVRVCGEGLPCVESGANAAGVATVPVLGLVPGKHVLTIEQPGRVLKGWKQVGTIDVVR